MALTIQTLWLEEDGVLSFEWTLLVTLVTLGIVGGIAAARDAIIDELGDTAQVMLAVDQSYHIAAPLASSVHGTDATAASDADFVDALIFTDCGRPEGLLPDAVLGQFIVDDNIDEF